MSVATVVTRGFGSFGSIGSIVRGGYAAGASVIPNAPGLEFTLPTNRLHYALPENLLGYTLDINRLHYTLPDEP